MFSTSSNNKEFLNLKIIVFLIVAVLTASGFLFVEKVHAQTAAIAETTVTAQTPNVIYGWVKRTDGTPMPNVQIWYCISSVPEVFPICLAKELGKSDASGKWFFSNPPINFYYRIWATYPNSYSQTISDDFLGGTVYWGDLYFYGNLSKISTYFEPIQNFDLIQTQEPIPASITKPYMEEVVVGIADGAKVVIPPSGAVLAGTVTVEIQPEIGAASFLEEIPSFLRSEVVSVIYDIIIRDEQGREVKELQKEIEITIPYKDEDIKKQGVPEDKIYPAYFDEAGENWIKIENYVLDKEKNLAIARVKHLTRFAIVAPADVSPPEAPTNKTAVLLKDGSVKFSWVNPKRDFHHVKIYRSEGLYSKGGNFGSVVFNDLTGTSILDKSVIGGKTYYYLIRSIDPAGNESENTLQLSVKTPAVVLKPAPSILEEEKAATKPAKEIIPPAPEVSGEPQVPPPTETPLPVEKPAFFFRIWQAIMGFLTSIFD